MESYKNSLETLRFQKEKQTSRAAARVAGGQSAEKNRLNHGAKVQTENMSFFPLQALQYGNRDPRKLLSHDIVTIREKLFF